MPATYSGGAGRSGCSNVPRPTHHQRRLDPTNADQPPHSGRATNNEIDIVPNWSRVRQRVSKGRLQPQVHGLLGGVRIGRHKPCDRSCTIVNVVEGLGSILRRTRASAGRSQATVAAAAGVGQPMISVYEHQGREPTWTTFRRLIRAAGAVAELRVDPLPPAALTLADLADHLATAEDDSRRRRLVLDFIGRYIQTPPDSRRSLLSEEPNATHDGRWDALLGALAEHLAFHDDIDPPQWCAKPIRFLDAAWYWVDLPSVRRRAVLTAPTSFRRRHIWIDRADLDRR